MNSITDKSGGIELSRSADHGFLSTEVTNCLLAQNNPDLFSALVAEYDHIVRQAAQQIPLFADRESLAKISHLARRAGEHDAVPADLIAIHLAALATLANSNSRLVVKTCMHQARLLLLKMVGELALYYRSKTPRVRSAGQ